MLVEMEVLTLMEVVAVVEQVRQEVILALTMERETEELVIHPQSAGVVRFTQEVEEVVVIQAHLYQEAMVELEAEEMAETHRQMLEQLERLTLEAVEAEVEQREEMEQMEGMVVQEV